MSRSASDSERRNGSQLDLSALDDAAHLAAVDRAGALADVEATPQQWTRAAALAAERIDLSAADAVVVCGMGGSAIGGQAAAVLAEPRLGVPVLSRRGFDLPAFVGPRTVVVAVSYSGRTEETLAAFDAAHDRGARLLGISGGGPLAERCAAYGAAHVTVEPGPQPRHAFGWLTVPLLAALGLDDGIDEALAAQREVLGACARDVPTSRNPAKQVAARLAVAPIVAAYGAGSLASVAARRLGTQLNENAKLPVVAAELPELGHNEVVAWQSPSAYDGAAVVWLRDPPGEHPRVTARVGIVDALVRDRAATVDTLSARGEHPLARLAALVLAVDLVSVYTAVARGEDPTPIPHIDRLKQELGS